MYVSIGKVIYSKWYYNHKWRIFITGYWSKHGWKVYFTSTNMLSCNFSSDGIVCACCVTLNDYCWSNFHKAWGLGPNSWIKIDILCWDGRDKLDFIICNIKLFSDTRWTWTWHINFWWVCNRTFSFNVFTETENIMHVCHSFSHAFRRFQKGCPVLPYVIPAWSKYKTSSLIPLQVCYKSKIMGNHTGVTT